MFHSRQTVGPLIVLTDRSNITTMTTTAEADEHETKLIVTGFGPFGGVPTNPTKVLVEKLQQYWSTLNDGKDDPELSKSVLQFIQLETSAEDVRDVIHRLKQQLSATKSNLRGSSCKETQRIVLLHLGVWASGSTGFKLERCAWNDASFRIPDEQGYHPMKEKIVDDKDFGQCMTTSLDLQRLSAVMVQSYPKIKTSISTDPGRFVCNYIYCTSLDAFRDDDNITSLFLHVPPFNVVDELDQLAYVTGLIRAIVELPTWSIINVK